MKWLLFIFLPIIFVLTTFEKESQDYKHEYYIGDWLYFSNSGFLLVEIEELKKITVYEYIDRESDVGEKDPNLKHYFYKSQGWVKNYNVQGLSIQTDKFRYDFRYRNDTLILIDELGEGWKLIRLKSQD